MNESAVRCKPTVTINMLINKVKKENRKKKKKKKKKRKNRNCCAATNIALLGL